MAALLDKDLFQTLAECIDESLESSGDPVERVGWFLESWGDPNDWRLVRTNAKGSRYTPLTTRNHARMGSREFVLETALVPIS